MMHFHPVEIIGVRHHSPACAKLVAARIRALRPQWVLIEGPSDFNPRISEMCLPHTLPIAIYSFCAGNLAIQQREHASWSPFAVYSPEWQALQVGHEIGAQLAFIDLPAWHSAFAEISNRYADVQDEEQEMLAERYENGLAQKLGIEGHDALWEHLFEDAAELPLPTQLANLAENLQQYFLHLRGSPASAGSSANQAREQMMARWINWAAQQGTVLVVCGGYHAPALAEMWTRLNEQHAPEIALPASAQEPSCHLNFGSYLLPYSNQRLDAFHGYASGMPSPAYQEMVWQHGIANAGTALLECVLQALRNKKLPASTADMQAIHLRALALARLRGHHHALRCDWLDALAGSLVKEALDAPLPWTYRGPLLRGTDPILVEITAVLAGEARGKLASGTQQPPLLQAIQAELAELQLQPGQITLNLHEPRDRQRSQCLHRLALLNLPGFTWQSGPQQGQIQVLSSQYKEEWHYAQPIEQAGAMIEAAIYGATSLSAASAKLEYSLLQTQASAPLAESLYRAAMAGLGSISPRLQQLLQLAIEDEVHFDALGPSLVSLQSLYLHGLAFGLAQVPALLTLLQSALERCLWLCEQHGQIQAARQRAHLACWQALRELVRRALADQRMPVAEGQPSLAEIDVTRALAVWQRKAHHGMAAALSRGAALGCLLSVAVPQSSEDQEVNSKEGNSERTAAAEQLLSEIAMHQLGDALQGLLALARHELCADSLFITSLDQRIASLDDHEFIVALPALRAAFAWLPSRERAALAQTLLQVLPRKLGLDGGNSGQKSVQNSAQNLVAKLPIEAQQIAAHTLREKTAKQKLQAWGLYD